MEENPVETETTNPHIVWRDPTPPKEIRSFGGRSFQSPIFAPAMSIEDWSSELRSTEVDDYRQQLSARKFLALGVFLLLVFQCVGVWFVIVWALNKGLLKDLQLIFSTMVAGSLTQSYFLLQLITKKIFSNINYHNSQE